MIRWRNVARGREGSAVLAGPPVGARQAASGMTREPRLWLRRA